MEITGYSNPCRPWLFVCENCGYEMDEEIPGEFGSYTNHFLNHFLNQRATIDNDGWCGRMYPYQLKQKRLI